MAIVCPKLTRYPTLKFSFSELTVEDLAPARETPAEHGVSVRERQQGPRNLIGLPASSEELLLKHRTAVNDRRSSKPGPCDRRACQLHSHFFCRAKQGMACRLAATGSALQRRTTYPAGSHRSWRASVYPWPRAELIHHFLAPGVCCLARQGGQRALDLVQQKEREEGLGLDRVVR